PGQCIYESSIKLDGNKVFAKARILNNRDDEKKYPARSGELPAVYSNGTYYRLFTYKGNKPFTNDELTLVPKRHVAPREFPWSRFQATENWAALVNDDNIGMAVYSPVTERFNGGFTGDEGVGSTFDIPCGYICPVAYLELDHNIEYEYSYVLVAGELEDMRKDIYTLARNDRRDKPGFDFNKGRQDWYYRNADDTGWPVKDILDIIPLGNEFRLMGPDMSFQAANITKLEVVASFETETDNFSFLWSRIEESQKTSPDSVVIDIIPGTGFKTYTVELGEKDGFKGLITGIHFSFSDMQTTDRLRIESINFR
ncbi:MAG: hypothetical protein KAT15_20065, partial [Bacteroidales bacterium]|nr:hypothetical protein [Bacteroidales bacterium]